MTAALDDADNVRGRLPGQDEAASDELDPAMLAEVALALLLSDDRHAHHVGRIVQDCMTTASAAGWRRRAETFEQAAPRPGDFPGRASPAELEERRRRCLATAAAARRHAALLAGTSEPMSLDVREYLSAVAS